MALSDHVFPNCERGANEGLFAEPSNAASNAEGGGHRLPRREGHRRLGMLEWQQSSIFRRFSP